MGPCPIVDGVMMSIKSFIVVSMWKQLEERSFINKQARGEIIYRQISRKMHTLTHHKEWACEEAQCGTPVIYSSWAEKQPQHGAYLESLGHPLELVTQRDGPHMSWAYMTYHISLQLPHLLSSIPPSPLFSQHWWLRGPFPDSSIGEQHISQV